MGNSSFLVFNETLQISKLELHLYCAVWTVDGWAFKSCQLHTDQTGSEQQGSHVHNVDVQLLKGALFTPCSW